jgi:hydroxyacylglutathione hydrolase
VLLLGFPSTAFATNCYVVAPAAGEECLIVDPGIEIEDQLAAVLTEHRLRPAAVLLTHGHVDHTYSVTPVCGAYGVAARIHTDDAYRLRDPLSDLDPGLLVMLERQFGRPATWQEPSDVVEVTGGTRLEIAGLDIGIRHCPMARRTTGSPRRCSAGTCSSPGASGATTAWAGTP